MPSSLERQFAYYLRALAPEWADAAVEQYRIVPGRRYAWDYAFPAQRVAVELHGGLHSNGAHVRAHGVQRDMAKANAATLAGWRVLYFSTDDLEDDPEGAISQLRAVLERTA